MRLTTHSPSAMSFLPDELIRGVTCGPIGSNLGNPFLHPDASELGNDRTSTCDMRPSWHHRTSAAAGVCTRAPPARLLLRMDKDCWNTCSCVSVQWNSRVGTTDSLESAVTRSFVSGAINYLLMTHVCVCVCVLSLLRQKLQDSVERQPTCGFLVAYDSVVCGHSTSPRRKDARLLHCSFRIRKKTGRDLVSNLWSGSRGQKSQKCVLSQTGACTIVTLVLDNRSPMFVFFRCVQLQYELFTTGKRNTEYFTSLHVLL